MSGSTPWVVFGRAKPQPVNLRKAHGEHVEGQFLVAQEYDHAFEILIAIGFPALAFLSFVFGHRRYETSRCRALRPAAMRTVKLA